MEQSQKTANMPDLKAYDDELLVWDHLLSWWFTMKPNFCSDRWRFGPPKRTCAANCLPFWPKKRSAKRHLSIVPGIFIENRQPKCQWVSWQQGWGGPGSSTHLLADAWNDWPLPSGMPLFSWDGECQQFMPQKDKIVWNCIFQQTVLLSQERNS